MKDTNVEYIYVIGLGRKNSNDVSLYNNIGQELAEHAYQNRLQKLTVYWPSMITKYKEMPYQAYEEMLNSYYTYIYSSSLAMQLTFIFAEEDQNNKYEQIHKEVQYVAEKVSENQMLLERPYELMNGEEILTVFHRLANLQGVSSDIFDTDDIHSLGMGGILSSSDQTKMTPVFVKLDYVPTVKTENEFNFFLVAAGGINTKVEHITNNRQYNQSVYPDRVGALLAFSVFEEIWRKKLPISISVVCPITIDVSDNKGNEFIRLLNGDVQINDSAVESQHSRLIDSIRFAKQENASLIVSLASLSPNLSTTIGGGYTFVITNDKNLQKMWNVETNEGCWMLPYDNRDLTLFKGTDLEKLMQVGESASPTPWFHIETLYSTLNKGKYQTHYMLQHETPFILKTLMRIQREYNGGIV
ncbi:hypothetical protein ACM26V_12685 [Salipaludibacillus sp. HK11]|uniref:hypothetical protein n=1 Tax=Salipaludibacillus sp. HK11 TaxID=3394320 RepID=UPI0039FD3B07